MIRCTRFPGVPSSFFQGRQVMIIEALLLGFWILD
jgi:hypothetical protein